MTGGRRDDGAMQPWSADVVLTDGATVHIRPATPDDTDAVVTFHERQSTESNYRRYFSHHPKLSATDITRFTTPDFQTSGILVAIDGPMLIAIGGWYRWPDRADADVAFQVDDEHNSRGLATILLEHLAASARAAGINRFTAETMTDNRAMLGVFTRAGWPVQRHFESGLIELSWELSDTSGYIDSVEDREQLADSRSMARFLLPRSIAIIGASDQPGSVGTAATRSVIDSAFAGEVYLVNPGRDQVAGRTCLSSLDEIDGPIDLALVAVPNDVLEDVIRACARRRVRGAVILSAPPFAMINIVAEARRFGLRLVGPASMGIISTSRQAPLQASLSPAAPRPGHVALSLQSGPLGAALLQQAANLQLGLSWFVSLGERSDVSGNDLLQFWEDDAETTVIAIYTERFGNPRKFARIARRVALTRPIVAVESGGDRITDALYLQAGVIRVPSVSDLLDTARVLASQPLPAGPRTAIIANATSPDRLTRNALRSAGLELATTGGRVLAWDTAEDDVADAIAAALADPSVDAVLVIHASPVYQAAASLAPAIERAAAGSTKPIVAVILGRPEGPIVDGGNVPGFAFPEPAALSLGRLWRYAKWRREEAETPAPALLRDTQAIADLDQLLASSDGLLSVDEAKPVFAAAGIAIPATRTAPSAADAVAFAEEIGFPVVLKRLGNRPLGRSVEAGIALDLRTAAAVSDAYAAVDAVGGVGPIVVQRMQTPGVEVRIAVSQHPALGPVLTVGPGGQSGTALGDHAQRLLPLSRRGITDLLASSRLGGLLTEHGVDFGPLTDLVERVSDLATQHDRIASIVLDPVLVSAADCAVSDAWIELHRSDTPTAALRQLD
jgi:acyl-CoA synthetase (NDP forming)/GNAT superfamily N-acetyltransferase